MKYNYVFFDIGGIDETNYYYVCTKDLRNLPNVEVVPYPLYWKSRFLHKLFVLHNHPLINTKVDLPFKNVWYPLYFENRFEDNKPICFVVYGYYIRPDYLRYLKRNYPNCKIVKIHRDLIKLWEKRNPDFKQEDMKLFDLTLTYDFNEANKYGIQHFTEIESKIDVLRSEQYPLYDVFFAGRAKDRLPLLLAISDYLTENDIKHCFMLTGVQKKDRVSKKGIVYLDKDLTYKDMLFYSVNSECILEIVQNSASGYTSRFLEAIMYDKKLITNNKAVENDKFYNENWISVIGDPKEIDINFIRNKCQVNFQYSGEFSPVVLLNKIEKLLEDE